MIHRSSGCRGRARIIVRLCDDKLEGKRMLIGYMRVSKADGSQVVDLQSDALVAAGVGPD